MTVSTDLITPDGNADASVVIAAFSDERFDDLQRAVGAIRMQTAPPREIIVVIDHNPSLFERVRSAMPDVVALENSKWRGATGARTTGSEVARGKILVFIDDDTQAAPDWLEQLLVPYTSPNVLGTGGQLLPIWQARRPPWFPDEFGWVVGCSFRGMPTQPSPIRSLVAANMSVRRDIFEAMNGFLPNFSKKGTRCAPEESEFCIRGLHMWPDSVWMYTPHARVYHNVPGSRARWKYFVTRCYHEGLGKAVVVALHGGEDGLSSERDYTFKTLPQGVALGLKDVVLHGDASGFARSAAIVTGLLSTTTGYIQGLLHMHLPRLRGRGGVVDLDRGMAYLESHG